MRNTSMRFVLFKASPLEKQVSFFMVWNAVSCRYLLLCLVFTEQGWLLFCEVNKMARN